MSDQNPPGENPPPNNPYDATPPPPYGQPPAANPYADQPPSFGAHSAQGYGYPPPPMPYAHWGKRVGAWIVDQILLNIVTIPASIGYFGMLSDVAAATAPDGTISTAYSGPTGGQTTLMGIGALLGLAFFVWNFCLRQGKTGQTIGKSVLGIKMIGEVTGQPIGALMSFVRQLAHIIDAIPCYLGFLWPLWDAKRQTFADKILGTVVIEAPKQ